MPSTQDDRVFVRPADGQSELHYDTIIGRNLRHLRYQNAYVLELLQIERRNTKLLSSLLRGTMSKSEAWDELRKMAILDAAGEAKKDFARKQEEDRKAVEWFLTHGTAPDGWGTIALQAEEGQAFFDKVLENWREKERAGL